MVCIEKGKIRERFQSKMLSAWQIFTFHKENNRFFTKFQTLCLCLFYVSSKLSGAEGKMQTKSITTELLSDLETWL